jgi:hypothetical protein
MKAKLSLWMLGCAGIALIVGCSPPSENNIALYPVYGKLLVDGQPAVGATIKFVPVAQDTRNDLATTTGQRSAAAIVQEDGTFEASYYKSNDGAPPGKYKLMILWLTLPESGGLPVDRLHGKYCDPKRSRYEIQVRKQENSLGVIELSNSTTK